MAATGRRRSLDRLATLALRGAPARCRARPCRATSTRPRSLGTPDEVRRRTRAMIAETGGAGHIVNLGHGVLPSARLDCVEAFFDAARLPLPRAGAARRRWPDDAPPTSRSSCCGGTTCRARATPPTRRRPMWKENYGAGAYEAILAESAAAAKPAPLSLYFHLPFCERLCYFCGCTVVITGSKHGARAPVPRRARSRDRLGCRAGRRGPPGRPAPLGRRHADVLPARSARARSAAASGNASASLPDAEIGVEVDPRVTTREHLEALARPRLQPPVAWASRISIRGPEGDQPDPALRRDAPPRRGGARPRVPEHQHGPHLRPPLPDAGELLRDDRSRARDRARTGWRSTPTPTSRG